MDKIKSFAFKLLMVLVAMWVINGVLSFFGGAVASYAVNPLGALKNKFFPASTTTA